MNTWQKALKERAQLLRDSVVGNAYAIGKEGESIDVAKLYTRASLDELSDLYAKEWPVAEAIDQAVLQMRVVGRNLDFHDMIEPMAMQAKRVKEAVRQYVSEMSPVHAPEKLVSTKIITSGESVVLSVAAHPRSPAVGTVREALDSIARAGAILPGAAQFSTIGEAVRPVRNALEADGAHAALSALKHLLRPDRRNRIEGLYFAGEETEDPAYTTRLRDQLARYLLNPDSLLDHSVNEGMANRVDPIRGVVRVMDLDRDYFILRDAPHERGIRCICGKDMLRHISLDDTVEVDGRAAFRDGKPTLVRVDWLKINGKAEFGTPRLI